ncbi:MAG: hypothetical protein A3G34_04975 [Candidatus Lindowbacteria bacterium RIFCSPLOWO2_12_FULL_62_27]|nr:MAG: hypothetical protein A3G34_04975 [Candidatus Lindowbacteria bacterium RIFCSPLOWO2_12_FULL_62_27]OGH62087.1 MAG: hypothetical protein A3I06_02520 [Candidatus Lindowbacteria bacterium RIFCSPLOWO2_02_FULL_62_12]
MAGLVYLLCAATALGCAAVLMLGYRRIRHKLLLWSALCFLGLMANNCLVFVDMVVVPHIDLFLPRNLTALAAMSILLYGLIWEDGK